MQNIFFCWLCGMKCVIIVIVVNEIAGGEMNTECWVRGREKQTTTENIGIINGNQVMNIEYCVYCLFSFGFACILIVCFLMMLLIFFLALIFCSSSVFWEILVIFDISYLKDVQNQDHVSWVYPRNQVHIFFEIDNIC